MPNAYFFNRCFSCPSIKGSYSREHSLSELSIIECSCPLRLAEMIEKHGKGNLRVRMALREQEKFVR